MDEIENLVNKYLNTPAIPCDDTEIQIIDKRYDKFPCIFILKNYLAVIISPNVEGHLGITLIENEEENKGVKWELVTWFWYSDIEKYQELLSLAKKWIEDNAIERDSFHYFT